MWDAFGKVRQKNILRKSVLLKSKSFHRLFLFPYFPTTISLKKKKKKKKKKKWVRSKYFFLLRILNTNPCFYLLNESQIMGHFALT